MYLRQTVQTLPQTPPPPWNIPVMDKSPAHTTRVWTALRVRDYAHTQHWRAPGDNIASELPPVCLPPKPMRKIALKTV